MKTETTRADVCTDRDAPGWRLQVWESTWAGLVGSRWRGELCNPEGRVVFAPHLLSSVEVLIEATVSHLTVLGLRHIGKALAELVRIEIAIEKQPTTGGTTP